jgi:hypothetical protein
MRPNVALNAICCDKLGHGITRFDSCFMKQLHQVYEGIIPPLVWSRAGQKAELIERFFQECALCVKIGKMLVGCIKTTNGFHPAHQSLYLKVVSRSNATRVPPMKEQNAFENNARRSRRNSAPFKVKCLKPITSRVPSDVISV